MPFCPTCGAQTSDDDVFCRKCGVSLDGEPVGFSANPAPPVATPTPAQVVSTGPPKKKFRAALIFPIILNIVIMGVVFVFIGGNGCSSTEGSFHAQGGDLGNFTFTPKMCKAGERMNFNGVVLLGEGPTDGGILVINDVVKGKFLRVEIPGSCKPPDYEICTEVEVMANQCKTFDMKIEPTSTSVNDVTLVDGHLTIDCAFDEGGTAKADIKFESCD